ncbi:MAG TPA: hypothetical protein VEW93_11885 [Acidimicrobiales bacterium]|nr:hypothetical protein [Acidimicrobiales bacterium]
MDRLEAARELELSAGASADDVERAFRRAARGRHPDVGGDPNAFRRAAEARAVLLRPPATDTVTRVVEVIVRYHPAVRLVAAVARAFERRPAGPPPGA